MQAELRRLRQQVGDLVAKHDAATDIRSYAKYADDPVGFLRDVLRCELWSRQVEVAELVRDHPRVAVRSANSIGKDFLAARLALWWVYACRGFAVLSGPTERQVRHILMREVRRAFTVAPELPGELFSLELRVDDSSGILAFASDNADRLTGFHHPQLMIVLTEAQGVEPEAFEAAAACVPTRTLAIGNPLRNTGEFYRISQSDAWRAVRIPASEHPNVVTGRVEIPGGVTREWVELMAEEYGIGSSIYAARVDANFPEESIEGLIRRDWLRAAFARFESGELHAAAARHLPLLALDVARYGADSSALAVAQGPVVRELVTWRGASITDTVDRAIAHGNRVWRTWGRPGTPPPRMHIDSPGLGGGAVDVARKLDWPVSEFNGASTPIDPTRFLNTRAESHWALRTLLENGKVAIPPDLLLEEEALACEWTINTSGKIQILSKDTMRATLGRSPDRLDATIIALAMSAGGLGRTVGTFRWKI